MNDKGMKNNNICRACWSPISDEMAFVIIDLANAGINCNRIAKMLGVSISAVGTYKTLYNKLFSGCEFTEYQIRNYGGKIQKISERYGLEYKKPERHEEIRLNIDECNHPDASTIKDYKKTRYDIEKEISMLSLELTNPRLSAERRKEIEIRIKELIDSAKAMRKVPDINEIDRSLKKIASDICTLSAIFSKFVRMTEEGERKDG